MGHTIEEKSSAQVAPVAAVIPAQAPAPAPAPEPELEPVVQEWVKISTVGFDARFPNQNQTKNCWQNYVDYFKCLKFKEAAGDNVEPCWAFKKAYKSLCPDKWTEKWDEEREANLFPALVELEQHKDVHH